MRAGIVPLHRLAIPTTGRPARGTKRRPRVARIVGQDWEFVPAARPDRVIHGPDIALEYWRTEVEAWVGYCPEVPWTALVVLDGRRRVQGHWIRWWKTPRLRGGRTAASSFARRCCSANPPSC